MTRGSKQVQERNLFEVLTKLEKDGFRASKKKSEFILTQTMWLGHEIDENGIKPKKKFEAIVKLKSPNNAEDLKYILDSIQFLAKFLPNHSEKNRQT